MSTTQESEAEQKQKAIALFLRETKQIDDELEAQEIQREALKQAISANYNKKTEVLERANRQLGLRFRTNSFELLAYLDGDIYHDGDGRLFRISIDPSGKSIEFSPVDCHGEPLTNHRDLPSMPPDRSVNCVEGKVDNDNKSAELHEANNRLTGGHNYLMTVNPEDLTVEDCLLAFGWAADGLSLDL